jgi:hypothetical protein
MTPDSPESSAQKLNHLTSERLGELTNMPMDTSRLDAFVESQIPRPSSARVIRLSDWLHPRRLAIAAGILAVALLGGLLLSTSSAPVMASTEDMAQFHEDMVSGRVPVMHVDSMRACNQALAAQWARSPRIPNMPADHVMACCMRSVKNKKVACVLLQGEGEPVSMTVANVSDVHIPNCTELMHNGVEYHVQATGSLNMVMTQRDGRWVCVIAKLPADRLMELASSLQF